jgi:hypothetical protein
MSLKHTTTIAANANMRTIKGTFTKIKLSDRGLHVSAIKVDTCRPKSRGRPSLPKVIAELMPERTSSQRYHKLQRLL